MQSEYEDRLWMGGGVTMEGAVRAVVTVVVATDAVPSRQSWRGLRVRVRLAARCCLT